MLASVENADGTVWESPPKTGCSKPLEVFMFGYIGLYLLRGNNKICYNFMCVTIGDPFMGILKIEETCAI